MIKEGEPRLLAESVLLGVIGALGAQLFTWMLRACQHVFLGFLAGYHPRELTEAGTILQQTGGTHGVWLIPLATTVGGLISGALVYRFAPEAEGHGTDTVVSAFHRKDGVLRKQVAPVKMVASAITIGSGGSAGREGPIALISAGLGSLYANIARKTEDERRLLLLTGMAAGLAAIFRTPMGTGVFAIEVLYGRMVFEIDAFLYTMVASAVAYTVNGLFVGWAPLFRFPVITTPRIADYGWYAALGVLSGVVAIVLPSAFYGARDFFRRLPIPAWTKPGLGGLGLGIMALELPQVLGGGYAWIQEAINGHLALKILLVLMVAKIVALALTVGSGGSGGVFAPSLFVGAMLGAAFSTVIHQPSAVFAVVGMAAVFGAAARVPVATMLMVTEMAGGYHLLIPAGLAVMVSYLLQAKVTSKFRYPSLYEGQVATRQDSPAHYLEHIQIALSLLGRRNIGVFDQLGHLDLLRLLRSKIKFDLPGGKLLSMGRLVDSSLFAGRSIQAVYQRFQSCEFEIIAILRREHIILPHPETLLQPEDRILVIVSPASCENLWRDLGARPIGEQEQAESGEVSGENAGSVKEAQ